MRSNGKKICQHSHHLCLHSRYHVRSCCGFRFAPAASSVLCPLLQQPGWPLDHVTPIFRTSAVLAYQMRSSWSTTCSPLCSSSSWLCLGKQPKMTQAVGPLSHDEKAAGSSWLLSAAWPDASCCNHLRSEPAAGRSHSFLALSVSVTDFRSFYSDLTVFAWHLEVNDIYPFHFLKHLILKQ